MRITTSRSGIRLKAYAGCTGVLLAFNVTSQRRTGLLGFALERKKPRRPRFEWMTGLIGFPGSDHEPGQPIPTNLAPIQRFRWSDYAVHPNKTYRYRVHAVYQNRSGTGLRLVEGPEIAVKTASLGVDARHNILFNRAAAASQAFATKFRKVDETIGAWRREGTLEDKTIDDLEQVEPGVKEWLSRGVLAEITDIITEAVDATWALDIAIYEYEWHEVIDAVRAAVGRGVAVRLLYHAKKGDSQTGDNEHGVEGLPPGVAKPRATSAIFHDKVIVLSRLKKQRGTSELQRKPVATLCGSTNFTENGIFRQANVVHTVRRPEVAARYLEMFEQLWAVPDKSSQTRAWITEHNPIDPADALFAGFSPRKGRGDLAEFVRIINGAQRDVLFATAFALPVEILDALEGEANDSILRLGVQNSRSSITGFHRDRTANFVATAMTNSGLEGWIKAGFKAETKAGQRGSILIHTKIVVVDFTASHPTVISGSHNLSNAASERNDENFLIIRENSDIADCYGVELMRIYDHYRFRYYANLLKNKQAPSTLDTTDAWTAPYFKAGSLKYLDRVRFAGSE